MTKTLSRSKSLRLRSPRQNSGDEESPKPFTKDDLHSNAATTRLGRAAAPAAVSGSPKHAKPTDSSPTRPSTAGGAMHRNQAGGALTTQYSSTENSNDAKNYAPISPTVFWSAEVHTNQGAHSAPLESGTARRTAPAIRPSPKVPGNQSSSDRAESLQSTDKSEEMEDSKNKVKRWKSLRSIFGSKKAGTYDRSARLTPPFGDYSGLQTPATAPTRLDRSPQVSARAWSDNERTPARLNKPLPAITSPQYTAPVPPTPPTNHQRDGVSQGGHRYRQGTTTKPMIDVDIPTTEMERYSVMFGGLLRSNTQPNLLVRRQANKMNPLQVDPPKPRDAPNLHIKPEPATPRTQARYQLSLFPPASPRSAEIVNPLRMHKPRPLQRSQTNPAPRSPTAVRANHQMSAYSNTSSEEVPVRLDITTESAYLAPPSHGLTIKTPELHVPNTEVMLLTPTPSTATSSRFSFISEDDEADIHVSGPLRPVAKEPMWEMMTPSPSASASTSGRHTLHRSESQTTAATSITSYSDDVVVEQHAQVHVSVAKSMSVTRAKSTKRYLEPKPVLAGKAHKSNERLVDRKPLTPTLVELRSRKSQQVQIEGF